MTNQEAESGLELVVDNRKLIIAFAILIIFCGGFFVLGFMEGKRQGVQEGAQTTVETKPQTDPAQVQAQPDKSAPEDAAPVSIKQNPADQPLDWYNRVNRQDNEPEPAPTAVTSEPVTKTTAIPPAIVVSKDQSKPAEPSPEEKRGPITYSVQVGAFLQKSELENRAKVLRDKGFDCRTESPQAPGEFYLLKIGRFRSRAEANEMKLRLKKSGIPSFVKTN